MIGFIMTSLQCSHPPVHIQLWGAFSVLTSCPFFFYPPPAALLGFTVLVGRSAHTTWIYILPTGWACAFLSSHEHLHWMLWSWPFWVVVAGTSVWVLFAFFHGWGHCISVICFLTFWEHLVHLLIYFLVFKVCVLYILKPLILSVRHKQPKGFSPLILYSFLSMPGIYYIYSLYWIKDLTFFAITSMSSCSYFQKFLVYTNILNRFFNLFFY